MTKECKVWTIKDNYRLCLLYTSGPGAGAGQQANQGSSSNNKEDIQDADFEEVK